MTDEEEKDADTWEELKEFLLLKIKQIDVAIGDGEPQGAPWYFRAVQCHVGRLLDNVKDLQRNH